MLVMFSPSLSAQTDTISQRRSENVALTLTKDQHLIRQAVVDIALALYTSDSLTEEQLATLTLVVDLCPLAAGHAVFDARALYALYFPNKNYNDNQTCSALGLQMRQAKPQVIESVSRLLVIPNPNNGVFEVAGLRGHGLITVTNTLGQVITQLEHDGSSSSFTLNTGTLPRGLYFVVYRATVGKATSSATFLVD
jgi:hypothetical protein